MKNSKKLILSTVMATAIAMSLASCNNDGKVKDASTKDSTSTADGHQHVYACPMHPEVTGKEGDKCPKCGMALEHNDNAGNTNTYVMELSTAPKTIEAAIPVNLVLVPHIKGDQNSQVPLDVTHDKKIHLIIVSEDLSYFDHIHPEFETDGSYKVSHVFPAGGNYLLFADFKPTGGNAQVEKIQVNAEGKAKPAVTYKAGKTTSVTDGFTVKLETAGGKFVSGEQSHISVVITKNGKEIPAEALENYLGAKAHMVAIGVDDRKYLHVHPEVQNGRLDLHTTFDKPGIYRGWLQFQTDGKVHTSDFVIPVTPGSATDSAPGSQHNH